MYVQIPADLGAKQFNERIGSSSGVFDDSKGTFKNTPDKNSAIKKSDFQNK